MKTNDGMTPLFLACSKEHTDMVKYLLNQNADVNITNYNNEAPIHIAVKNNNTEIVRLLIEHKAKIDAKTLSIANSCDNKEIASLITNPRAKQMKVNE
jgi:ankyrin repeat protein